MIEVVAHAGRALGRGLRQLIYPDVCPVCCGYLPPAEGPCCAACRTLLTTDPLPSCPRCAATVGPFTAGADGCGCCREERLHFDAALRLGPHDGRLRELVLGMKYGGGPEVAALLGAVWAAAAADRLAAVGADVVVPVPLHWLRYWQRGYNQSAALAEAVADRLRLPCRPRWLTRIRHTPAQTGRTPAARRANVRGAFRAGRGAALGGRVVLLVDDVMTTGSTCSEAARALKQAGAARVVAAVLSHG
jgi:ComF family protein